MGAAVLVTPAFLRGDCDSGAIGGGLTNTESDDTEGSLNFPLPELKMKFEKNMLVYHKICRSGSFTTCHRLLAGQAHV